MTTSPISSKVADLNTEVIEATEKYKSSKSTENLKTLIEKTMSLSTLLRKYEFNHNNKVLEDFDEDICLEYLGMIMSNRQISNPRHKLSGIISKRIYQHNKSSTYTFTDIDFYADNHTKNLIDSKLVISDIVKTELFGVSDRLKVLIIYYLTNFKLLKNFITFFPSSLDKYVVVLKVYDIRKKIMNESERNFDITFSKNRIANLLMLSGLFNESPEMFVLLTLLGDFKKFLTFISLFENQKVSIPKISDINAIFQKSSGTAKNFDEDALSIKDKENMLSLVTNTKLEDVTPDTKINKFLEDYVSELVLTSIENYNKIQDRHLKNVDFTNQKKVKEAYTLINDEMTSASRLLREIFVTVATIKEINTAINQIKKD